MNQCESNECKQQGVVAPELIARLNELATDVSTPEVTVSLPQYKVILDGIAAHHDILNQQKAALERRLVETRKSQNNILEQASQRVGELQAELTRERTQSRFEAEVNNLGRCNAEAFIARQNEQIADLQKQLRAAKRNRK